MKQATDVYVYNLLCDKFMEIISKHNNAIWAIEELEWLVFDKHAEDFWNSSEEVQWEVRKFMMSINKLYK